jgi:uncharacterized repeat protein (TIGR01451 family)
VGIVKRHGRVFLIAMAGATWLAAGGAPGLGGGGTALAFTPAPPAISATFLDDQIAVGSTVSLGFVIENPESNPVPLTGVSFTDTLPAGLRVLSSTAATCGGTRTQTKPSGISLSGAEIAVGSRCKFSVTVTAMTAGVHTNVTSAVTADAGGPGNVAVSSLVVWAPPTIVLAVADAMVERGHTTSLDLALSNMAPTTIDVPNVDVEVDLPVGVMVSASPGSFGGATVTAASQTIRITGATIVAGHADLLPITVTGVTAGSYTITARATANGWSYPGNTATAHLAVSAPPPLPTPTPRPTPTPTPVPAVVAPAGSALVASAPTPSASPAPPAGAASPLPGASLTPVAGSASSSDPGRGPGSVTGSGAGDSGVPVVVVAAVGAAALLALLVLIVLVVRRRRRGSNSADAA